MKWFDKLKNIAKALGPPPGEPESADLDDAFSRLTPRERDVFRALLKVRKVKDAAEELGVKYPTIHTHCKSIYKKLRVGSRAELIMQYGSRNKNSG